MYNKEIEALVDAALTDGVLTEKEKQILYKKAESMGIDLDEFEMVLQSRLYDKQKQIEEERKKNSSAAPKSNKMGDVRKCPACGAIVSGYQVKCLECGYEFTNVEANSSAQLLADKLVEVSRRRKDSVGKSIASMFMPMGDSLTKEQVQIIETFPIPNTKADLLEFITSLEPRANVSTAGDYNGEALARAYGKKLRECINKAKSSFKDDPDFAPLIKSGNKSLVRMRLKRNMPLLIGFAFIILFFGGFFALLSSIGEKADECAEEVVSYLDKNDPVAAERCINQYDGYPEKACNLLMNYYIDKNETEGVIRLARSCDADDYAMNLLVYNYLIKNNLYDEAKDYVGRPINESTYNSHTSAHEQEKLELSTYIKDVINSMSKDGKKDDAIKFLHREVSELGYDEQEKESFISNMMEVIENY